MNATTKATWALAGVTLIDLAFLIYGMLRLGPFSDAAVVVGIALAILTGLGGLLVRFHVRKSRATVSSLGTTVRVRPLIWSVFGVTLALGLGSVAGGVLLGSGDARLFEIGFGVLVTIGAGLMLREIVKFRKSRKGA